jgi:ribonuclease R
MTKPEKNKSKKTPRKPSSDPHAAREAQKYENPITSREHILELLQSRSEPLTHPELADCLSISDPESYEALRRRLIAMTRDGQLICNRRQQYLPAASVALQKGVVIGHRDGFGFVKLEKGGDDLYLSAKQMQRVFDGDTVLVRVDSVDHRGKGHGVIVEVLERNTDEVVGRIFYESGLSFIEIESVRQTQQVMVPEGKALDAKHGQYVVAKIVQQPSRREHALAEVVEILGDHLAPGMEIEVAIRSHNIPHEWPQDVSAQVAELSSDVKDKDKIKRIDIRHLPLVTIDGEDARDFDDAVYCERLPAGGWKLYVAIADVSHYVVRDSALDVEANKRGTSVYFPDHVIPMLPEVLSNGLCSLNPKVDRLCMVCEMDISPEGIVQNSVFYEGVMHSHARLTYNQVGCILEEPDSSEGIQLLEDFAERLPQLYDLYSLYTALRSQRSERGAIDFETVETLIIFGEDRKIESIVPRERNDAHKIIEECMLCANVATAEFLIAQKLPALYRVHEGPKAEKLENLRAFLSEQGLQLWGGESPKPADYQSLFQDIAERPDFSVIQTMMLRSMSQAVYSPEEKGHFGLAYDHYAHFTSPIRRYPDLLVHRAIKSVIYNGKPCTQVKRPDGIEVGKYAMAYDFERMLALGEHCSLTERRADDATRDVTSWLKCEYLQQHIGEVFEGLIAAVTGFGFFVELADLYVEGLVHVATLDGDFYQFDQQKQRLIGERTGARYGLGDKVTVQVAAIKLEERKIDLVLVGSEPNTHKTRKKAGRKDGSKERKSGAGVYGKKSSGKRSARSDDSRGAKPGSGQKTGSEPKEAGSKRRGKDANRKSGPKTASSTPSKGKKPLKVGKDLQPPITPNKALQADTQEESKPRRRAKLHAKKTASPTESVQGSGTQDQNAEAPRAKKPRKRQVKTQ